LNITRTALPEVLIIEPKAFGDDRGHFYESYNERSFDEVVGRSVTFVQDNHSHSTRRVLRGLHYQLEQAQGKLVRVVSGAVYDVAVDLRRSSPNFGRWVGVALSAANRRQLWVPEGFGHGYLVTSDEPADFLYKTTDYYAPKAERCIAWNDATLAIDWPLGGAMPIVSGRDQAGSPFAVAEVFA
jgi:dTDP-4-dehydrorhamnose 3,5-epimerase